MQRGELRVVTRNTPATFYIGADEPRGIEYELAQGFADRLGVQLRIYPAEGFRHILPEVARGKADLAAAALTVTDAHDVEFGPAYQSVTHLVVYRRGTKQPRTIEELMAGRLEIVAGSAHAETLRSIAATTNGLCWTEASDSSTEGLLRRVAAGEIDYTMVDSNLFELLRHFHPDVHVAFELGEREALAWALPKSTDVSLREEVAAYFAEIEATGTLDELLERYYAGARQFDYVGARAFMRHFESRLPQYRSYFEQAGFEIGIDWRLLAAIAYQESHWNPDAVSPTKVAGMMMLTERTAAMMDVEDRTDARESIVGGARYFRRVLHKIPTRILTQDRLSLAIAAYNIGFGHLEDARILTQIQGGDPDQWEQVRERLPLLSDEKWHQRVPRGYARGAVAVSYVDNVRRYYDLLLWMTSDGVMLTRARDARKAGAPG
jgi:membrane-bound lytic murein transglycosylase F